jgi:hypothetical protein
LVRELVNENDRAILDVAIAAEMNLVSDAALAAADAAREAGNAPNTVMAAAAAIVGPKRIERALACSKTLIDLFAHSGLLDSRDETFDVTAIRVDETTRTRFLATGAEAADPRPQAMLEAVRARGGRSLFLKFLATLGGVRRGTPSWPRSQPRLRGDLCCANACRESPPRRFPGICGSTASCWACRFQASITGTAACVGFRARNDSVGLHSPISCLWL